MSTPKKKTAVPTATPTPAPAATYEGLTMPKYDPNVLIERTDRPLTIEEERHNLWITRRMAGEAMRKAQAATPPPPAEPAEPTEPTEEV